MGVKKSEKNFNYNKSYNKKEGDKQHTKKSMIKVCITTLEERSKTIPCPVARPHIGHVREYLQNYPALLDENL